MILLQKKEIVFKINRNSQVIGPVTMQHFWSSRTSGKIHQSFTPAAFSQTNISRVGWTEAFTENILTYFVCLLAIQ